jgi:small subunit ribosomal protein S2
MRRQPEAVFIVDLRKEQLAVREARRLGLPIVALVDTNCDPDEADYIIPGNDDAIRSCSLIIRAIADGIAAGQTKATPADFQQPTNGNGATAEAAPPGDEAAETPAPEEVETTPEGDYEQVSPGEEPMAETGAEGTSEAPAEATTEEANA